MRIVFVTNFVQDIPRLFEGASFLRVRVAHALNQADELAGKLFRHLRQHLLFFLSDISQLAPGERHNEEHEQAGGVDVRSVQELIRRFSGQELKLLVCDDFFELGTDPAFRVPPELKLGCLLKALSGWLLAVENGPLLGQAEIYQLDSTSLTNYEIVRFDVQVAGFVFFQKNSDAENLFQDIDQLGKVEFGAR